MIDGLKNTRSRLNISADQTTARIDRFLKRIRDFARDHKLLFNFDNSVRFALFSLKVSKLIQMIENDNPLFNLVMKLRAKEMQQAVLPIYKVKVSIPEALTVELNQVTIVDGNGRELEQKLMLTSKRSNRKFIEISPYLLFNQALNLISTYDTEEQEIKRHVIKHARKLLRSIQRKREDYANKKRVFLKEIL